MDGKVNLREGLEELAYNLWWTWNPSAKDLFRSIDPILWERVKENPIALLTRTDKLEGLTNNGEFLKRFKYVFTLFKSYISKHSQYSDIYRKPIVFFSPEYGLHHSLLIYAGGLGFLAGDILKECSDMGFPMVGVGFMYPQGYVSQRIRVDGWQEDLETKNGKENFPARKVLDAEGNWLKCYVYCRNEKVFFGVWEVDVGKVKLYLLDTDVEENPPWNREISSKLYISDKDMRLKQQIVLGFGGIITLEKLGIEVGGIHINEDYPAFALLAKALRLVKLGASFEEALERVRSISLFTTHTPLKSAINLYPFHMIEEQFLFLRDLYHVPVDKILALGTTGDMDQEGFNTTVMAMRMSGYVNGVSKRHGEVSKTMWGFLRREAKDIDYVTNGIHLPTWLSEGMRRLFGEYLGENWVELQDRRALWELVDNIPDELLWEVHLENKRRLIDFIRRRARERWAEEKADPSVIVGEGLFLEPNLLTVGFARRMTAYKRPDLIFYDLERLERILTNPERPVQIVFAGKAHPADVEGKRIIQRIFNYARDTRFGGRIAFVEDYDELLAHYMVSGVDVWLNNPLPPLEACGTSGMKASINGVIHLSVLDGWWVEGFNGNNGWAFGDHGEEDRNKKDAEDLYNLLEKEIVPLYYDWDEKGVPRRWVKRMKEAIKSVASGFCARRMMKDYIEKFYRKILEEGR